MKISEILLGQTQAIIAVVTLIAFYRQSMIIQKHATEAQLMQNYLKLKEIYRAALKEIVQFPGDYKVLANQTYSSIKDENVRATVFEVLDILNDVLHYYKKSGLSWKGSAWEENLNYIFSKRLFSTAFYDKQANQKIFDPENHEVVVAIIEKMKKKRKDKIRNEKLDSETVSDASAEKTSVDLKAKVDIAG